MIRPTKAQVQNELQAAHAKIERLSRSLVQMREIVSIQKCLAEARQILIENPELEGADLLAAFISRVWWIDLEPDQLRSARLSPAPPLKGREGLTTSPLPPLSPKE